MKKLLSVLVMTAMVLAFAGMASATASPQCTSQTVVGGTIYQDVITNGIEGADVDVTCGGQTLETTSLSNGAYSVVFDCSVCDLGDAVSVHAQKASLTGDNSGAVDMRYELPCGVTLDVGIVNVPMVPEFGGIVAGLTIMGALGAFLIVRRN